MKILASNGLWLPPGTTTTTKLFVRKMFYFFSKHFENIYIGEKFCFLVFLPGTIGLLAGLYILSAQQFRLHITSKMFYKDLNNFALTFFVFSTNLDFVSWN